MNVAFSTDVTVFIITPLVAVALIVPGFVYRLHKERRARTWKVHPCTVTRELDLGVPADDVRSMAITVISEMGIKQSTSDSQSGEVCGVSGWSWRSWGQELIVSAEATGPHRCRVVCITWPHLWKVSNDWGAGRLLMDELVQRLERRAALQSRVS